jgi:hypothetical protein
MSESGGVLPAVPTVEVPELLERLTGADLVILDVRNDAGGEGQEGLTA